MVISVTCQTYNSFLSPLNDAHVGLSQVIFLPEPAVQHDYQLDHHQHHLEDEYKVRDERNVWSRNDDIELIDDYTDFATVGSDYRDEDLIHFEANEEEIGSADRGLSDDVISIIDPVYSVFNEEPTPEQLYDQPMSGSYAYIRNNHHEYLLSHENNFERMRLPTSICTC